MILLVPLDRFQVEYQIGSGKHYSEFDGLVLKAIGSNQQGLTLSELKNTFFLPDRLIIEIVINLVRAGWVSVIFENDENPERFNITPAGQDAINLPDLPNAITISQETAFVIMEKVTGSLINNHDIIFRSLHQLNNIIDKCYKLSPAEEIERDLDEGQVNQVLPLLLHRKHNQWIKWINKPVLTSADYFWLPVDVDLKKETVNGLPFAWKNHLNDEILTLARQLAEQCNYSFVDEFYYHDLEGRSDLAFDQDFLSHFLKSAWEIPVQFDDIIMSDKSHWERLLFAFNNAHSRLLIASAFLDLNLIGNLEEQILGALQRGVTIDLLWGYERNTSLNRLKDIKQKAQKLRYIGKIRFNDIPTESHAKILIFNMTDEKNYQAYLGSYNWLSNAISTDSNELKNISFKMTQKALIADIARCVASFWRAAYAHHLTETPLEWQTLASDLAYWHSMDEEFNQHKSLEKMVKIRFVRDQEHEHILRYCMIHSQERCVILSHKISQIGPDIRLAGLKKRQVDPNFRFALIHGEALEKTLTDQGIQKMKDYLEAVNGDLLFTLGMHSKVLICDDIILISSYNFLSTDPFGLSKNAREIGILIQDQELADILFNKVDKYILDDKTN